MTYNRLFCNASLIRQNLRQHGWIGILYTLVLLFMLPLQLFADGARLENKIEIDSLFGFGTNIYAVLIAFPIIAGLFLSRYLQSKGSSDLMHSLPLRRSHLLSSYTLSGLLLLLPPIWITSVVTMLVRPLEGNMYIYHGAEVWGVVPDPYSVVAVLVCLYAFCGDMCRTDRAAECGDPHSVSPPCGNINVYRYASEQIFVWVPG